MYPVEVNLDSELFSELFEAYSRSRITGFENYLESISSRVDYTSKKGGFTLLFEDERERTLFLLK